MLPSRPEMADSEEPDYDAGAFERLGDQLIRLGFNTKIGKNPRPGTVNETPTSTEVQAGEDVPEWARRDSNARPLAPEAVRAA